MKKTPGSARARYEDTRETTVLLPIHFSCVESKPCRLRHAMPPRRYWRLPTSVTTGGTDGGFSKRAGLDFTSF